MTTIQSLRNGPAGGLTGLLLPESALKALLYTPLMTTNVLATMLICYKAWYYEQNPSFTEEELITV